MVIHHLPSSYLALAIMASINDDNQGPAKKQKQDVEHGSTAQTPKAPGRFKVVSKVIMAMRRFQGTDKIPGSMIVRAERAPNILCPCSITKSHV